ncbi:ABC transporter substrate-binding protein [uncultured Tenacibaculum sp.]|uniref:ABC transporter substrate-binding protein n=1 Tax=uncultured Tenacibaculum sp. TaxID=174713 RepID=UPI0026098CD6|nr:ABC transporter substrate-binding protein [uncultured Tenacibaculum sp.]
MKHFLSLAIISLLFFQCKKAESKEVTKSVEMHSPIKYAKGFDIITQNGQKKLVFKRVFQNSKKQFTYTLTNTTNISKNELKVPINELVVTSTTHIPMLELLSSETKLVGFPHTKYISSEKTRKLIEDNKVVELGSEQNMNTEKLMDLNPELVIGFSLHPNNKLYENIKKSGIPVIFNGDWLEETPLGRAEWIKFFGALLNKEKEADSIFKIIELNYTRAIEIAKNNKKKPPTVLSGSMFKDVWNLPAGESFMATYLKDANLNYLWKETNGTGSLQLSFESVLDKGKNADYWIGCGLFETKEQMLSANKHYKEFNALIQGNVYTIGSKKGKTGGLLYFELAPVRPDLVLKDFIKITNPKLLPNYKLTFFEKLK